MIGGVVYGVVRPPVRGYAPNKGGGVNPPYPAPAGYRWVFVTTNGRRVTRNGQRVITLVRAA